MNQAHFHLMVNHLPIIFPIAGLLVLIGGIIFRSEVIKRTAYFLFVTGAVTTLPSFISGEGAEEVVEGLQGVSEAVIEKHEDIAKLFAFINYGLGALSLVALWASWKGKSFAAMLGYIILVVAFVSLYFGKETGTTGGEVRHTEIRSGGQAQNNAADQHGGGEESGDDD